MYLPVEDMISADLDGRVRIMLHREQVRQQLSNTTPQAKLTWNIYLKYLGYVKLPQTCTVSSDCSRLFQRYMVTCAEVMPD